MCLFVSRWRILRYAWAQTRAVFSSTSRSYWSMECQGTETRGSGESGNQLTRKSQNQSMNRHLSVNVIVLYLIANSTIYVTDIFNPFAELCTEH